MAALSVFANGDADDSKNESVDVETVQNRLLWISAQSLLRSYDAQKYKNENVLKRMSHSQIIEALMKVSLQNRRKLNLQNIEEIVSLILLSDASLIVAFIQNAINCNKSEWQTIAAMLDPNERATDNSMNRILKKTAIYDITKYLYNRKNQATFLLKQQNRKNVSNANRDFMQLNDEELEEEEHDSGNSSTREEQLWE